MTQPKRDDELALWAAVFAQRSPNASRPTRTTRELARRLGIPQNRAVYLCEKWCRKGWYDYGVHPLAGWATPEAPEDIHGK